MKFLDELSGSLDESCRKITDFFSELPTKHEKDFLILVSIREKIFRLMDEVERLNKNLGKKYE